MKSVKTLFFIAVMILSHRLYADSNLVATLETQPNAIVIFVPPIVLDKLKTFLQPSESPETFDDFARAGNYRDLTDYFLLRRALTAGGSQLPVEVKPWPDVSYDRLVLRLRAGQATVFSNGIWREDFSGEDDQLKVTSPLMAFGELEAGLFMSPDNPKLHTTKTLADVHKLTAVSSKQWRPDWNALEQLGLEGIYDNVHWESMVKMVRSKRVDFMLSGFSRLPDLSYQALGITLVPVPGVKVKLPGSRGWVVSMVNTQGPAAYKAIEKGLKILHEQGVIVRAYRGAGAINDQVADWKVLNPEIVESRGNH